MKKYYNFVSLIALGYFNPAIVTQDFLNTTCGLNLGEPTDQSPPFIPVSRLFNFNNLSIDLTTDRLQIREIIDRDINQTRVLDIFRSLYNILPYTPINILGININGTISFEESDDSDGIMDKVKSYETYKQFYNVDVIDVVEDSRVVNNNKNWLNTAVKFKAPNGITHYIRANMENKGIKFNFNYEVDKLDQDKSKLDLLLDSYSKFNLDFDKFTTRLEA